MRNIAEIIVFHTPLDDIGFSLKNSENIARMTEDFLANSGENFEKISENFDAYLVEKIILGNIAKIFFFTKKREFLKNFEEPFLICKIFFDTQKIPKNIVENFLDTIIRFFSGQFREAYFLDYDADFQISPMNVWKKYSLDEIKNFDFHNKNSSENKKFLDGIFALRYRLYSEKFSLENAEKWQISDENFLYLNAVLESSQIRQDLNHKAIVEQISTIEAQMKIILQYFE